MRTELLGLLLTALGLAAAGCGGLQPLAPVAPPPDGRATAPWALAPVRTSYEPTDAEHRHAGRYLPRIDALAVERRTRALFAERGAVGDVRPLSPDPREPGQGPRIDPPGNDPNARGGSAPGGSEQPTSARELEAQLQARVRQARDQGESRLLDVSIDDVEVHYDGQRLFPLKVVFVVMLFPFDVPNYFIASDRFSAVARARWRLLDTSTGQQVAEGTAVGRQEGTFGDLSRGWYFLSFLREPQCLDDESWGRISSALLPGAQESLAGELVVAAERAALGERAGVAAGR